VAARARAASAVAARSRARERRPMRIGLLCGPALPDPPIVSGQRR
jgi:hypothetical protein